MLKPPEHLSDRSKQLWRKILDDGEVSPGRAALFQTALECLDRADEARAMLADEGLIAITSTTGASHAHPLLKIEKDNRQLFARLWQVLNLQYSAKTDGTPIF